MTPAVTWISAMLPLLRPFCIPGQQQDSDKDTNQQLGSQLSQVEQECARYSSQMSMKLKECQTHLDTFPSFPADDIPLASSNATTCCKFPQKSNLQIKAIYSSSHNHGSVENGSLQDDRFLYYFGSFSTFSMIMGGNCNKDQHEKYP